MKAVIILPTYNEYENLRQVVEAILNLSIEGLGILVVDDNSPDGTGRLADALARQYATVSVLHRSRKEGLGKAYVAGFRQVLQDASVKYIFEMDADLSHQPKYIPGFLKVIDSADVVLGSRYMAGGGVKNWNWSRRLISRLANKVIRIVLGLQIMDLTSGFKCFRRQVLEQLDLERLESRGYNFQIELTYQAQRAGWRIKEIPIVFLERRAGYSKFSIAIMFESFWRVLKLRFLEK